MAGEVTARTSEDVDDMVITAAQVKAIASGNPRILERVSIEVELARLSRLYTVWRNGRRNLKWELESLPGRVHEADLRVAGHEQAQALRDQNPSSDGAFKIKLKRSVRNDEWLSFDHRTQAGEHLDKLRREVGMRLDSEYCFIGSYRGFQILVQRQRDRSEALLTPVEGFLCVPESKLFYPFNFGDSAQGTIQSIDAQFKAIDTHLQRALKYQAELKHKQEQIEKELAKGWDYAQKYEELQAQFQRVNQLLKEDGSQVDDKHDFAALDQDAFQKCEPRVEAPIQATEVVSAHLEIAPIPFAAAESAVNSIPPVILEQKDAQPEETPVVVAEQTHHHVTLDDLRNQPSQKNTRKPSTTTRAEHSAQLSLWQ